MKFKLKPRPMIKTEHQLLVKKTSITKLSKQKAYAKNLMRTVPLSDGWSLQK
jgi:hypothetical protein